MDNPTAIKIINGLRFLPGWSFEAFDMYNDTIMGRALIETVNSNQEKAKIGYPEHVTLERTILVHPEDYATADDLSAALFTWITEILLHEGREFLRLSTEDFRAPFHPHRPEGEDNWRKLITHAPDDPMRGLIVLNV